VRQGTEISFSLLFSIFFYYSCLLLFHCCLIVEKPKPKCTVQIAHPRLPTKKREREKREKGREKEREKRKKAEVCFFSRKGGHSLHPAG
jgi:hypothetical protein